MSRQETINLIIGLISVLVTLSGAILAWRKWKPTSTNIQVTTADTLVDIAVEAAGIVKVQRDELQAKLVSLEHRLTVAENNLHDCTGNIRRERDRAERAAIAAERHEHALLARIEALEEEVRQLRSEATEHFPPPGPHDPS